MDAGPLAGLTCRTSELDCSAMLNSGEQIVAVNLLVAEKTEAVLVSTVIA
jgi:hypothetical protein